MQYLRRYIMEIKLNSVKFYFRGAPDPDPARSKPQVLDPDPAGSKKFLFGNWPDPKIPCFQLI